MAPQVLFLAAILAGETEASTPRAFFEKLIAIRLDAQGYLFIERTASDDETRQAFSGFFRSFGGFSRRSYRFEGGSGSSGGSEGGHADVEFEPHQKRGRYRFSFETADGKEALEVNQGEPGHLTIMVRSGPGVVFYLQAKGRALLAVAAADSTRFEKRRNFRELFSLEPELVHERLIAVLERYLAPVAVERLESAPAGAVLVHLRTGERIVGRLGLPALRLETAYGELTVPRRDLKRVIYLEGAAGEAPRECTVVTRRFTAVGRLDLGEWEVFAPYGVLRVAPAGISQVAFGEPEEDSGTPAAAAAGPDG